MLVKVMNSKDYYPRRYHSFKFSLAEMPFSDSEDSDDSWKAFVTSSSPVDEVAKANNGFVPRSKHVSMVEKDGVESGKDECSKLPNSSMPVKRNKWKSEEVKKLINLRGELHCKFHVVKGRMALWEQISGSFLSDGINRSPGQCKPLWTSLVLKYEETKNGKKSKKSWPYFEDMNRILSDLDVMAAK